MSVRVSLRDEFMVGSKSGVRVEIRVGVKVRLGRKVGVGVDSRAGVRVEVGVEVRSVIVVGVRSAVGLRSGSRSESGPGSWLDQGRIRGRSSDKGYGLIEVGFTIGVRVRQEVVSGSRSKARPESG